ncbi:lysine transporter LysE [Candidatus Acidianus copahuensis]|uniref:Lysine transporter LysE n=2 Tax=Candidatus Acidianus copahuensis TaxID=1160895 RepID=A0A031LL14_9CREN|nr:lysine transporter LysE [Candidatus Acidianus copahuensis]
MILFYMIPIILGILLGLSMAAPPGPINAIMAFESTISRVKGSLVGLGAMTADLIFFVITYTIKGIIPLFVLPYLYISGGILMFYLGYLTYKAKPSTSSRKGNYFKGLTIGLSNPYQISWWLTTGLFAINNLGLSVIPSFFAGILIWIASFVSVINKIGSKYINIVKIFSLIILISFGTFMMYNGITALL